MSHPYLPAVIALVQRAGQATLPHWRNDVAVTEKADASPVTAADLAAHDILASGLRALAPEIPVLSEEDAGIPFAERADWQRWWLVDPLDGTKEFISGSEEFTVNVALIERGRVVFGVVGVPANGRCYFGGAGLGAWRQEAVGAPEAIAVRLAREALDPERRQARRAALRGAAPLADEDRTVVRAFEAAVAGELARRTPAIT